MGLGLVCLGARTIVQCIILSSLLQFLSHIPFKLIFNLIKESLSQNKHPETFFPAQWRNVKIVGIEIEIEIEIERMNYEAKNFSHAEWAHSNLEQYRCIGYLLWRYIMMLIISVIQINSNLEQYILHVYRWHIPGSQKPPEHNLKQFARLLLNWSHPPSWSYDDDDPIIIMMMIMLMIRLW